MMTVLVFGAHRAFAGLLGGVSYFHPGAGAGAGAGDVLAASEQMVILRIRHAIDDDRS